LSVKPDKPDEPTGVVSLPVRSEIARTAPLASAPPRSPAYRVPPEKVSAQGSPRPTVVAGPGPPTPPPIGVRVPAASAGSFPVSFAVALGGHPAAVTASAVSTIVAGSRLIPRSVIRESPDSWHFPNNRTQWPGELLTSIGRNRAGSVGHAVACTEERA